MNYSLVAHFSCVLGQKRVVTLHLVTVLILKRAMPAQRGHFQYTQSSRNFGVILRRVITAPTLVYAPFIVNQRTTRRCSGEYFTWVFFMGNGNTFIYLERSLYIHYTTPFTMQTSFTCACYLKGIQKQIKTTYAIGPQLLCRPFCLGQLEFSISTANKRKENQSAQLSEVIGAYTHTPSYGTIKQY